METLISNWIGIGILFLILEFFTGTTYGLGLGIGSFMAALFVWFFDISSFHAIGQYIVFLVVTIVFAIITPKLLNHPASQKIGPDQYIGKKANLKKVGSHWKVEIEGVDYLVETQETQNDWKEGMQVTVKEQKSGILVVEKTAG